MPPLPRESWVCFHRGHVDDKDRPAIVTSVSTGTIEVIYARGAGLKNAQQGDEVFVRATSPDGLALGLSKDSFFRFDTVAQVPPGWFRKRIGKCPALLFVRIAAVVQLARRRSRVVTHLSPPVP